MLLSHRLTHHLCSNLRSLRCILVASGCGCKEATHCLTLFPVNETGLIKGWKGPAGLVE